MLFSFDSPVSNYFCFFTDVDLFVLLFFVLACTLACTQYGLRQASFQSQPENAVFLTSRMCGRAHSGLILKITTFLSSADRRTGYRGQTGYRYISGGRAFFAPDVRRKLQHVIESAGDKPYPHRSIL
jgi:hypothetical protein